MYSLISDPYLAGVLAFSREIHDFESNLIDSYAQELNPDAQTGHVFCTLNFVIDSEAFFSLRGEGRDPVAATFTVRAPFDHVGFSAEKNAN
jgi:hypothetical protein